MQTLDLESRLSERVRSVPPSGIRRFFEIAATMDNVISLGIGEPDFVSPQPVIDAAKASLDAGKTGYTANAGLVELREAISDEIDRLYDVRYDPASEILVSVGVSEALQLTMLSLLGPGDEVLIPEPCFVSYGPTAKFAGAEVVYVPTSVEHDLLVISDEIYDRLVYGASYDLGHTCLPSIPSLRDRTVLLGGFSKNYAMTGWRIGYACAPPEILKAIYKCHQYVVMSAPTMGQIGAVAALKECQPHVEEMRQAYDARRRVLVDGLNAAGLPTFEPEGAFYAFPDVTSTGLSSEEFAQRLLREERVAVVPGDAFGPSGSGYVRCSYATSLDNVKEAVGRITDFVERLRK
jgi:aminotransferase